MNLIKLKETYPSYQFTVLGVPYENWGSTKLFLCLGKNRPDHLKGKIMGPGGKLENSETPEMAMKRELKEETDLSITEKNLNHLGHIYYENTKTMIFLYAIELKIGNLTFAKQLTDEKLLVFNKESYKYNKLPFSETTKIVLRHIFSH